MISSSREVVPAQLGFYSRTSSSGCSIICRKQPTINAILRDDSRIDGATMTRDQDGQLTD
jgi:hypothetical protein